jgi:glutamate/tyrosine decarboxylase-like PLP-dependent enzyme
MSIRSLLVAAQGYAATYLETVADRHVGGTCERGELLAHLGGPLPEGPSDPDTVLANLVRGAEPGIVASVGPRYFGFVIGGALPVTVAADWLASAWDQNGSMYVMSPTLAVMEDIVSGWLLETLGLPAAASVGFVTGAHMANFTCLAAARHEVLRRVGWNVEEQGLQRAPHVRIVVGDHAHVSVIGALRMLGFGAAEIVRVAVDDQGRMQIEDLDRVLAGVESPSIVCVQAGNVGSGGSDPVGAIVGSAHRQGAWVHVDGAFGLWANAVTELRDQVTGIESADSWATDAHKWLNVPYDSGLAIVAHPAPHRAAMGLQASYLIRGTEEERIGMDWAPESSRRARVIPLYVLFRTLGRSGIQKMIRRTVTLARRMAARLGQEDGVRILNDVVLNQVLARFDGRGALRSDAMTKHVIARVQADGTCWAGGAKWFDQEVMRLSISNWSTTEEDIDRSADSIVACYRRVGLAGGSSPRA